MKKYIPLLILGILLAGRINNAAAQEQITITTYYPAPYGVYNELRLFPKATATACSSDQEGLLYYNNTTHQLNICMCSNPPACSIYAYQSLSNFWTLNGNTIHPSNTAWNVGIGTAADNTIKLTVADGNTITQTGVITGGPGGMSAGQRVQNTDPGGWAAAWHQATSSTGKAGIGMSAGTTSALLYQEAATNALISATTGRYSFTTCTSGVCTEKMSMDNNGNVHIYPYPVPFSPPSGERLDVVGSNGQIAIWGASWTNIGVEGSSWTTAGIYGSGAPGVYGISRPGSSSPGVVGWAPGGGYGVQGYSSGTALVGTGGGTGIYTEGSNYAGNFQGGTNGIYAKGSTFGGYFQGGTYGISANGNSYAGYFQGGTNGIYAAGSSYAGYFNGYVYIAGNLSVTSNLSAWDSIAAQNRFYTKGYVDAGHYYQSGILIADYVFEPDYALENIDEHADYMWKNKHLKAIPSSRNSETADGKPMIDIGATLNGTVEELEKAHIYIAQLNDRIKKLEEHLQRPEKNRNAD